MLLLIIAYYIDLFQFYSFIKIIREFLPNMLACNHGHVVSLASIAGCVGLAGAVDYCSSKFAAFGLMESLRREVSSTGVTGVQFTTVCPSLITTGMFEGVKFRWVIFTMCSSGEYPYSHHGRFFCFPHPSPLPPRRFWFSFLLCF